MTIMHPMENDIPASQFHGFTKYRGEGVLYFEVNSFIWIALRPIKCALKAH